MVAKAPVCPLLCSSTLQQLFRDHYFLNLLPDFGEGMQGHIFYILGLGCRGIRLVHTSPPTLTKLNISPHQRRLESPAVKKSLPSLRLWCLLNSECLALWLRCIQQLVIPVRRVLAPQFTSYNDNYNKTFQQITQRYILKELNEMTEIPQNLDMGEEFSWRLRLSLHPQKQKFIFQLSGINKVKSYQQKINK